jgi:dihydrofolate reductase
MSTIVVNSFVTLDGVMQAPGGPEEDPSGGFTHGGWSVGYWDEEVMPAAVDAGGERMGGLLLGRRTYEIFAAHWPHVTDDPMADRLNAVPKFVASTTLTEPSWSGTTVLGPDVPAEVARLKETDLGEIHVFGSSRLIQTLLEHDLIDALRLMVFPVVLGRGKRLFGSGAVPAGLTLVDSAVASTGVIVATYERGGSIAYGSFALEEPTGAEVDRRERVAQGG